MQAKFQYKLSKDEYVVGLTALMDRLGRHDTGRTARLFEQLAMCVAVLAAVAIAFPAVLEGLLVATVLLSVLLGLFQSRWLRSATGQSYDPAVADHDVEITNGGIRAYSPLRDRRWSWAAVRAIHDLKTAVVLEFFGWDMVVVPNRLWSNPDERRSFIEELRAAATDAVLVARPVKQASIGQRDMLVIGAIAAAVDVFALMAFTLPVRTGASPTVRVGTFAVMTLLSLGLAYLAFRLSRRWLERLYDSSSRTAMIVANALVWAVPAYILIAYLGWI